MPNEKIADVLADNGLALHRGGDVVGMAIDVSNTGHGLADAVGVNPVIIPAAETGYVVFEVAVDGDGFKKVMAGKGKDAEWTGEWTFIQKLKAGTALLLLGDAADVIRSQVRDQAERVRIFREEQSGQYRLDRALQEAHKVGDHALERVVGCLACETEEAFERLDAAGRELSKPEGMTDEAWEASARSEAAALPPAPSEIQNEVEIARQKREERAAE